MSEEETDLTKLLESYGEYETPEALHHLQDVLKRLEDLFRQWVRSLSPKDPNGLEIKIVTFGSQQLGVRSMGADVDVLCLAPTASSATFEGFFCSFKDLLMSQTEVVDLRAVPDAYAPVIKLRWEGIDIDLNFAICDDFEQLDKMDQKSLLSVNGYRVTREVLAAVPSEDKEAFRLALRVIKLWAKRRGIYSNALGYLSGVSCAILLAKVCQLHPTSPAPILVRHFFRLYNSWNWPEEPVFLKEVVDSMDHRLWNPEVNVLDRLHLMPVITPAFPEQNSTANVSKSTFSIMKKEIELAVDAPWNDLFEMPDILNMYKHYLEVEISSSCKGDQSEWLGLVESKVRHLVQNLEKEVELLHLWPYTFNKGENRDCWIVGIVPKKGLKNINLTSSVKRFSELAVRTAKEREKWRDGMTLEVKHKSRKQLKEDLPRVNEQGI